MLIIAVFNHSTTKVNYTIETILPFINLKIWSESKKPMQIAHKKTQELKWQPLYWPK